MNLRMIKSNLFLLTAAAIWGFAFVAQKIGAEYVGSFTFNGVRFALGSLSLIPIILFFRKKSKIDVHVIHNSRRTISIGVLIGCVSFIAVSLQQIGLVETSAGKAAFINGLYIVIVPILGIFLKHRTNSGTWIGVILAVIGLYPLCVTDNFTIMKGDLYELIAAIFWAIQILLVGYFANKIDILKLSFYQFVTCSVLSLVTALIFETITLKGLLQATAPLLYGGILSVGGAYTLQAVGQKYALPAHAAIILSLEAFFASIGGLIILHENLGLKGYLGCLVMLLGVLISQVKSIKL